MYKSKFTAKIVIIYELFRFFLLLVSHPIKAIQYLPPSWYAAVPLLVMPLVLAILMAFSDDTAAAKKLYALAKAVSAAGIAAYIVTSFTAMGRDGALVTDYLRKQLFMLLIFFVIDAILAIANLKKTDREK